MCQVVQCSVWIRNQVCLYIFCPSTNIKSKYSRELLSSFERHQKRRRRKKRSPKFFPTNRNNVKWNRLNPIWWSRKIHESIGWSLLEVRHCSGAFPRCVCALTLWRGKKSGKENHAVFLSLWLTLFLDITLFVLLSFSKCSVANKFRFHVLLLQKIILPLGPDAD